MKYIYTGVFFDLSEVINRFNCNIGAAKLSNIIENPHVTFTFKPKEVNPKLFGKEVVFRVIGYACDGKNQGLQVEYARMSEKLLPEYNTIQNPHITISVSEDGKPVDTGKLKFEPIENPFYIAGTYGTYTSEGVCTKNPAPTVYEFCRNKTEATELVVICDGGWRVATVWIDYEDIFQIPEKLRNKTVLSDKWEKLPIVDNDGNKTEILAHHLYV